MKGIVVLLFCFYSLFTLPAAAQHLFNAEDERSFHAGFTSGANFCEVIGDAYHGYHKVGYYGGVVAFGKLSPEWLLSLGLQYANKGSRGVREINSSYVGAMYEKYYLDLAYAEVSGQLWCRARDFLWIGGGMVYGRLLSSREDIATDQPVALKKEQHEFLKKDLSFRASALYCLNKNLMIDAGYQRSLRPVRNWDKVPEYFGSGNQYNIHFSLGLTYLF